MESDVQNAHLILV